MKNGETLRSFELQQSLFFFSHPQFCLFLNPSCNEVKIHPGKNYERCYSEHLNISKEGGL